MAKNKESSVRDRLLIHALGQFGYVLRPYPKELEPEKVQQVITKLREDKLVHGTPREPNLTADGIEAARDLTRIAAE